MHLLLLYSIWHFEVITLYFKLLSPEMLHHKKTLTELFTNVVTVKTQTSVSVDFTSRKLLVWRQLLSWRRTQVFYSVVFDRCEIIIFAVCAPLGYWILCFIWLRFIGDLMHWMQNASCCPCSPRLISSCVTVILQCRRSWRLGQATL